MCFYRRSVSSLRIVLTSSCRIQDLSGDAENACILFAANKLVLATSEEALDSGNRDLKRMVPVEIFQRNFNKSPGVLVV